MRLLSKAMKEIIFSLLIIVLALLTGTAPALAEQENHDKEECSIQTKAILLNNEGVEALSGGNYAKAISKLEAALKTDPSYKMAGSNYAIALNNWGLACQNEPEKALHLFERALYFDFDNITTQHNSDGIVRMMSLDPKDPAVRLDLGSKALLRGDLMAAITEFRIATQLCAPKPSEPESNENESPNENHK